VGNLREFFSIFFEKMVGVFLVARFWLFGGTEEEVLGEERERHEVRLFANAQFSFVEVTRN
jgi:hypothetical protein